MYFMYETAFAGALLNIDTFNQPGVEEGKKPPSHCSEERVTKLKWRRLTPPQESGIHNRLNQIYQKARAYAARAFVFGYNFCITEKSENA